MSSLTTLNIIEISVTVVVVAIALVFLVRFLKRRRRSRKVSPEYVGDKWRTLQKNCATRKTWPKAIAEADDLVDEVLKGKGYKGKTPGERLVAAQHDLSSNEMVWFGHKYRKQIADQDVRTLKKQDVLNSLSGFRQALKDLEVLPA